MDRTVIENFIVETEGFDNPALIYLRGTCREPAASFNPKEIFFYEKGMISYKSIEKVEFKKINQNETACTVFVAIDELWNTTQKKKHPVRWRLGLIDKSEAFDRVLGKTKDHKSIDTLIAFFAEKGINVDKIEL